MSKGLECKRCGGNNIEFKKSWKMKAGRSKIVYEIELWYCNDCKKSFRIWTKVL